MKTYFWNKSISLSPLGSGLWRIFIVPSRRNLIVSSEFLELINQCIDGITEKEIKLFYKKFSGSPLIADAGKFTLWDSPYNNPDLFDPSIKADDLEFLSYEDLIGLLLDTQTLYSPGDAISNIEKQGFADRFRGNFYEQIGTEALFNRIQPEDWWTAQKFTEDLSEIRPNAYRYIEENFLDSFFVEELVGKDVLEIGSGTGYFTNKLAKYAKHAVGVDYNKEYVETARRTWNAEESDNLSFEIGDIINIDVADFLNEKKFDAVVLIDMFLFLFDSKYQPHLSDNRSVIMKNMVRLLNPKGRIIIMDPHPFWLSAQFGEVEAPVIMLTEYKNRSFKVSPTLQEISDLVYTSGMRIRRIIEPEISEDFKKIDEFGYSVMSEFPQWWMIELEKS